MAGHRPEHARQTATLRWAALGTLIPNNFFVEAALGRFARCRYSAIQNNVQTNTYDPRRHGATPSLLSCRPNRLGVGAFSMRTAYGEQPQVGLTCSRRRLNDAPRGWAR